MDRFQVKNPVYPIFSIICALASFVVALALARSVWGGVFLVVLYILLFFFGYAKTCLKLLPFWIVYLAVLTLIFYFAGGRDPVFAGQMAIRLSGVVMAALFGLSMEPVALVRCLTQRNCPRLLTLGMLITLSFIPVLMGEIRQVQNAMKTRGVTSVFHPTVLYRAFLIPLIVRLCNISDTLALSVETRGFVSEDGGYTVYKPVNLQGKDVVFAVCFVALAVGCIVCAVRGVVLW